LQNLCNRTVKTVHRSLFVGSSNHDNRPGTTVVQLSELLWGIPVAKILQNPVAKIMQYAT
jgi:hypothetical protein